MRTVIFILIVVFRFDSFCQQHYILNNFFGLQVNFKDDLASLKDMYLVKCPENIFDSTTVVYSSPVIEVDGKIIKLNKYLNDRSLTSCNYSTTKLQTFLFAKPFSDSLAIFATFYSKKIFQIDVLYLDSTQTPYLKQRLMQQFKSYSVKMTDGKTTASTSFKEQGFSSLTLADSEALHLKPTWCGNAGESRDWEKLEKYLHSKK